MACANIAMTLDDYIRKQIDADKAFTVSGFAAEAGMSHSQLNRLRHGTSRPSLKAMLAIKRASNDAVELNDWHTVEVAQ